MATHVHRHHHHRPHSHHHRAARHRAPAPGLFLAALHTTFNRYDIVSYAPQTHGQMPGHSLARSPIDGTLWVIYLEPTRRYYYAKYSTDDGVTWSAPELVWDSGSANSRAYPSNGIFMGTDGQPMVQCAQWNNVNAVGFYLAQRRLNTKPLMDVRRDVVARQPQARGGYSTFSGRQGGTLPQMIYSRTGVTAGRGSVMISPPPLGPSTGYNWSGMGMDGLILGGQGIENQNPVWLSDDAVAPTYWWRGYFSTNTSQDQAVVQRSPIYGRTAWPTQSDYNAFWNSQVFTIANQSSCHWFMDKYKRVHIVAGGVIGLVGGSGAYGLMHATVPTGQPGITSGSLTATTRRDIAYSGPHSNVYKPLSVRGCIDENGIVHVVGLWVNQPGNLSGSNYNTWWVYGDWEKGDWYPPRPLGGSEIFNALGSGYTRVGLNGTDPFFITARANAQISPAYPTKTQLIVYQTRKIPCHANHQPDMNANRRVPPRKGGSTIFCGRAGGDLKQSFSTRQDQPQHGGRMSVCGPTYSGLDIAWTRTQLTTENKNWSTAGEPVYSRVGQQQAPLTGFQFLAANDIDNKLVLFNFGGLRTYRSLPDNTPGVHTMMLEKTVQRRSLEQGRRMGWRPLQPTLWHPTGHVGYPWPWKSTIVVDNRSTKTRRNWGLLQARGKRRQGAVDFSGPPSFRDGVGLRTFGSPEQVMTRTQDGSIWFAYGTVDKRYMRVRRSTDNGRSWQRDEVVWDSGPAGYRAGNYAMFTTRSGFPVLMVNDSPAAVPSRFRIFVRENKLTRGLPIVATTGGARAPSQRGGTSVFTGRCGATLMRSSPGRYDKPAFSGAVNVPFSNGPLPANPWIQRPLFEDFSIAGAGDSPRINLMESPDGQWHCILIGSSGTFGKKRHWRSFDGMNTWRVHPGGLRDGNWQFTATEVWNRSGWDAKMDARGDIHFVVGATNSEGVVFDNVTANVGVWPFGAYQKWVYTPDAYRRVMATRGAGVPPRKGGSTIFCGRAGGLLQSSFQTRYDRPQNNGSIAEVGPAIFSRAGAWPESAELIYNENNNSVETCKMWWVHVVIDRDNFVHVFFQSNPNHAGRGIANNCLIGCYTTNRWGKGMRTFDPATRSPYGNGWLTPEMISEVYPGLNGRQLALCGLLPDGLTPYAFMPVKGRQTPLNAAFSQWRYYERDWRQALLRGQMNAPPRFARMQQSPQRKGGHTNFSGKFGESFYPMGQKTVDRPGIQGQAWLSGPPLGKVYRDVVSAPGAPDLQVTGNANNWKRGVPIASEDTYELASYTRPLEYSPARPWESPTRGVQILKAGLDTAGVVPFGLVMLQDATAFTNPRPPEGPGTVKPLSRIGNGRPPSVWHRWTGEGPWLHLSLGSAFIQVLAPTVVRPNQPNSKLRVPGFVWVGEPPAGFQGSVSTFAPKFVYPTEIGRRRSMAGRAWIGRPPLGKKKPHVIAPGYVVGMSIVYKPDSQDVYIRAWIENADDETRSTVLDALDPVDSYAVITDDQGNEIGRALGQADGLGPEYVAFSIPAALAADHRYRVAVVLSTATVFAESQRIVPVVTVR